MMAPPKVPATPIRPEDVASAKGATVPGAVLEAFNELITERMSGGVAVVRQSAVLERILAKMPGRARAEIFRSGWLDIEDVYRAAGWKVDYDRPGYNETYEATFTFEAVRR